MRTLLLVCFFLAGSWVWDTRPVVAQVHYGYDTATLDVIFRRTTDPYTAGAGLGALTLNAEPAYPAPTGCDTGRYSWMRVNQHPNPTTIVLKSDLKIFRCQQVFSAAEVDAIVDQEAKALCDSFPQPDPLVTQLKLDVDRICEGESSEDCTAANTAYEAVKAARSRVVATEQAEAKRLTEAIQELHTEAETFKTAQGW